MAFRIQLPTISQALGDLYPMKIYYKDKDKKLPCDIMEILENQEYGVANLPVDKGFYVGDNIYKNPLVLSVRVFVRSGKLDTFLKYLNNSQTSDSGFLIKGMDGQTYENMRLTRFSASQNKDVIGGYFYNLDFIEMQLVSSYENSMATTSVSNVAYSQSQDLGSVTSTETKTSTLKDLLK